MTKSYVTGVKTTGRIFSEMKKMVNKERMTVQVEYDAPYAIYVHEDLTKHHPKGQAKFLEEAVRRKEQQVKDVMKILIKFGDTLESALIQAAQLILEESQKLVPVDTGYLKSTGKVVLLDRVEQRTWK